MFAIQMTTSAALPGGPARPAGGAHARSAREQPGALEVRIPDDGLASLEEASAIQLGFPREFLALWTTRNNMFGDIKLETGLTVWQLKPSPALDAVRFENKTAGNERERIGTRRSEPAGQAGISAGGSWGSNSLSWTLSCTT